MTDKKKLDEAATLNVSNADGDVNSNTTFNAEDLPGLALLLKHAGVKSAMFNGPATLTVDEQTPTGSVSSSIAAPDLRTIMSMMEPDFQAAGEMDDIVSDTAADMEPEMGDNVVDPAPEEPAEEPMGDTGAVDAVVDDEGNLTLADESIEPVLENSEDDFYEEMDRFDPSNLTQEMGTDYIEGTYQDYDVAYKQVPAGVELTEADEDDLIDQIMEFAGRTDQPDMISWVHLDEDGAPDTTVPNTLVVGWDAGDPKDDLDEAEEASALAKVATLAPHNPLIDSFAGMIGDMAGATSVGRGFSAIADWPSDHLTMVDKNLMDQAEQEAMEFFRKAADANDDIDAVISQACSEISAAMGLADAADQMEEVALDTSFGWSSDFENSGDDEDDLDEQVIGEAMDDAAFDMACNLTFGKNEVVIDSYGDQYIILVSKTVYDIDDVDEDDLFEELEKIAIQKADENGLTLLTGVVDGYGVYLERGWMDENNNPVDEPTGPAIFYAAWRTADEDGLDEEADYDYREHDVHPRAYAGIGSRDIVQPDTKRVPARSSDNPMPESKTFADYVKEAQDRNPSVGKEIENVTTESLLDEFRLQELSNDTKNSYFKKASDQINRHANHSAIHRELGNHDMADQHDALIAKRARGMNAAIAKEDHTYSAKAAAKGKDLGKPGKNFDKIAKKAAKEYGSKEAGERVAGAVLAKLRHKHESVDEDLDIKDIKNHEIDLDDPANDEVDNLRKVSPAKRAKIMKDVERDMNEDHQPGDRYVVRSRAYEPYGYVVVDTQEPDEWHNAVTQVFQNPHEAQAEAEVFNGRPHPLDPSLNDEVDEGYNEDYRRKVTQYGEPFYLNTDCGYASFEDIKAGAGYFDFKDGFTVLEIDRNGKKGLNFINSYSKTPIGTRVTCVTQTRTGQKCRPGRVMAAFTADEVENQYENVAVDLARLGITPTKKLPVKTFD